MRMGQQIDNIMISVIRSSSMFFSSFLSPVSLAFSAAAAAAAAAFLLSTLFFLRLFTIQWTCENVIAKREGMVPLDMLVRIKSRAAYFFFRGSLSMSLRLRRRAAAVAAVVVDGAAVVPFGISVDMVTPLASVVVVVTVVEAAPPVLRRRLGVLFFAFGGAVDRPRPLRVGDDDGTFVLMLLPNVDDCDGVGDGDDAGANDSKAVASGIVSSRLTNDDNIDGTDDDNDDVGVGDGVDEIVVVEAATSSVAVVGVDDSIDTEVGSNSMTVSPVVWLASPIDDTIMAVVVDQRTNWTNKRLEGEQTSIFTECSRHDEVTDLLLSLFLLFKQTIQLQNFTRSWDK
jgi:hypothetical protein